MNMIWFMQIDVLNTKRDHFLVTHYKSIFFVVPFSRGSQMTLQMEIS